MRDMEIGSRKRQTFKQCEYPKMEKAFYKREHNFVISVEVVKAKARKLHEKFEIKDGYFNASNGHIKKRHGICYEKFYGGTF